MGGKREELGKKKKKQSEEANSDTNTLKWLIFLGHTPKFTEPLGFRSHLDWKVTSHLNPHTLKLEAGLWVDLPEPAEWNGCSGLKQPLPKQYCPGGEREQSGLPGPEVPTCVSINSSSLVWQSEDCSVLKPRTWKLFLWSPSFRCCSDGLWAAYASLDTVWPAGDKERGGHSREGGCCLPERLL